MFIAVRLTQWRAAAPSPPPRNTSTYPYAVCIRSEDDIRAHVCAGLAEVLAAAPDVGRCAGLQRVTPADVRGGPAAPTRRHASVGVRRSARLRRDAALPRSSRAADAQSG